MMLRFLPSLAFIGLVASALPAYALDCASPDAKKDEVVIAICNDPQLIQADKEMNDAYSGLYRGRDKQQQRVIKALQKAWLWTRRECDNLNAQCLLTMIRARTDFLKSADGIGPASQGKLLFKGYYLDADETWGGSDISLFEFENPDTDGRKSFNAAVDKIFKDSGGEDNPTPDTKADVSSNLTDSCSGCSETKRMGQPFQVKGFISAPLIEQTSNGYRIYESTTYINQYLDKEATLSLNDLLEDYDTAVLAKLCYDQVMAGLEDETSLPEATTGDSEATHRPSNEFMGYFRDPTNWQFDGKSITFVLPFNDLEQSCTLPYEMLKPHLVEGAMLPVR